MVYQNSTVPFEKMLMKFVVDDDPMQEMLKWLCECFLQTKNAYHCSRRTNEPRPAFLLLATCHNRMANPVTWPVKNNEMTVVH